MTIREIQETIEKCLNSGELTLDSEVRVEIDIRKNTYGYCPRVSLGKYKDNINRLLIECDEDDILA